MKERSRKPENFSFTPGKEPKAFRQGSVGEILRVYQAKMPGNEFRDPEQSDLPDHLKTGGGTGPSNPLPFIVQRKPEDFKVDTSPGIASVAFYKKKSGWGQIENAIQAYSGIDENNIQQRKKLLEQLVKLISLYQQNQDTDQIAALKRDARNHYCNNTLSPLIVKEYREIDQSGGRLAGPAGQPEPEPEISKQVVAQQNEPKQWLMFNKDAQIVDKDNKQIGTGTRGKVAKRTTNWDAPTNTGINMSSHYEVQPESIEDGGTYYIYFKTGYVMQTDVTEVPKIAINTAYKYSPTENILFPHPPVKEDVNQGRLGDCYLLAAMIAVVKKDDQHFITHMRDNRDRTVTVKLYDDAGQAVSVTIRKTVVSSGSKPAFARGALWVPIYEKAYVAAGFHGGEGKVASGTKSYGFIEGGYPDIAMRHITGKTYTRQNIDIFIKKSSVAATCLNSEYFGPVRKKLQDTITYKLVQDFAILAFSQVSLTIEQLSKKTFVSCEDLILLKQSMKKNILQTIKENLDIGQKPPDTDMGNFTAALRILPKAISDTLDDFLSFIDTKRLLTGKLGYGNYSEKEIKLFKAIQAKIDAGQPLTISTRKDIFNDAAEVERKGGSAGENVVKGLAGPHAYAVLDYAPNPPVPGSTTSLSLLLRNPWGHTGRAYKKSFRKLLDMKMGETITAGKIERIETQEAESWIDLADIAAFFTHFSHES